jgi:hypothetical protein
LVGGDPREREPARILGAPFLGLLVLIAVVVLDIALSWSGLLGIGHATTVAYAGLAFASILGGTVTGLVSGSPVSKSLYLAAGATAFWGLFFIQAASSDGHPDRIVEWAPIWHLFASPIGLWLIPRITPAGGKLAALAGALFIVIGGGLAYGQWDRALWFSQLKDCASTTMKSVDRVWLPRLLEAPPTIRWDQPTYSELGFKVHGILGNGRGGIDLSGRPESRSATLTLNANKPFSKPTAQEDDDHLHRRAIKYLRAEGISEETLEHLNSSSHDAEFASQLNDVPADSKDLQAGTYFISLNIWPHESQIGISLSPGPVRVG